jgi:hypothetical protein
VTQLRAVGVTPGQVLLVHASFRALRPAEGGPQGVLEALLEALGTVGQLERAPLLFLHSGGDGCAECDEARASVPG